MISLRKQRGMALFVAMLMLPLILVLGVLAMNNSFLGLKMIDARVLKGESDILLNSATNELLNRTDSAAAFANATNTTTFSYGDVNSTVELNGEIDCKRRINASGTNFKCKYVQVHFEHSFGRQQENGVKWALNTMSIGVEQPMLSE